MNRPTRHQMFMGMARAASTRATCYRLSVGAVIVSGERDVVAIGYNGASSGRPHCTGNGCSYFGDSGCTVEHAEANALSRLPPLPTRVLTTGSDLDLYVTHSPCGRCAARLVERRIARVFFETAYRDPSPLGYLVTEGVRVFQLMPSGFLVDYATGCLVER